MNPSDSLQPLNILLMHGPELASAGLDPREFSQAVSSLPNCRVLSVDPALSITAQEEHVRGFLNQDPEVKPVILVAKDPEYRGAGIARLLTGELGLKPESLLQVDLTAALEYPDPSFRSAKGLEMIRLAASQVDRARPSVSRGFSINSQVLVWGDSYASLKVAWELAELDYPVILASSNREPNPLAFEYAEGDEGNKALASLVKQVQEHSLISLVQASRIKDFGGVTGNFTVRLDTPEGVLTERVGAVVLAPELHLQENPHRYNAPDHPGVVSQTRLEARLAAASEAEMPGTAAFLVGLAGESHPLALGRALKAVSRLLDAGSQVYLLVDDAKLAGPGLQRDLRANQEAGLILIKLRDCPAISTVDEGLVVSFFEPSMREELSLKVDLVVLDDQYQAPESNAELAELFGLPLGSRGFLQDDNVHHIPVATSRRGIYVVGPARGIMDLTETEADVNATVYEIQGVLGQGTMVAPQGPAVVDRGKCVLCLTCLRLCPHGAITWDNRAIINELACQGCGICASQCPNEAIQVQNCTDAQVTGLLEAFDPELRPRIVAFMCRNSAWEAYQTAVKFQAASLPLGFTPIKVPCAGKVDPNYVLQAFNAGADGVLVLSCPQDNCKSSHGNLCAERDVEQVQGLLAEAGVDPNRLLFHSLAANAPGDFINAVDHLMANLSRQTAVTDEAHPFWLTIGTTFTQPPAAVSENPEVCIELNAQDALDLGLRLGDQIRTSSSRGAVTATVVLSDRVRPGTAFVPMHSREEVLKWLVEEALDPIAQMPEYKGCAVSLAKLVEHFEEVLGLKVPTSRYLHRGHTWLALETGGRVRLGMDDFSQKILGPGDAIQVPLIGEEMRRDKATLALCRRGERAGVLAPVDGVIEAVNPNILKRPGLVHDDPYGEGWLMVVAPTNLQPDLDRLVSGEGSAPWIEEESMRLLAMLESTVGPTFQSGGTIIDDVYGQYPQLGWDRLIKEFLRSV